MDNIDIKLLRLLQEDSQLSYEKLGVKVGLSVSGVNERIKKLQKQGVIVKWQAHLSAQKVGLDVLAFIYILIQERGGEKLFVKEIEKISEILECHHVTGEWSYLLKIRCKNIAHFEALLGEKIKKLPSVVRTHTTIALSSPVERTQLPLSTDGI